MGSRDFTIYVEDDRIQVRFVGARRLGTLSSGHPVGGDYDGRSIRLPAGAYRTANQASLLHELGHHFARRQGLRDGATEEEACELLSWLPRVLADPRNRAFRSFLGLRL